VIKYECSTTTTHRPFCGCVSFMFESHANMASTEDNSVLLSMLGNLSQTARSIISLAREEADENTDEFVSKKIGKLFQIVGLYKQAFQASEVGTKAAFEEKIKAKFRDERVRDAYEDLLDAEQGWDDFLLGVDSQIISGGADVLTAGDQGPVEEQVMDVHTGQVVPLSHYTAADESSQFLLMVLLRHFA